MNSLDNYLKHKETTNKYIVFDTITEKYKKFNYDDEDDLILDLELLLDVKYKNMKIYETKDDHINYKKLKKLIKITIDEDDLIKLKNRFIKINTNYRS
tara:strand:+ start:73 stop:366 length:294 start_codon:yes stop_codon:yes gene_type:complete